MALALLLVTRALAVDPWQDAEAWAVRAALREAGVSGAVLGAGLDSPPDLLLGVPVEGVARARWVDAPRRRVWTRLEASTGIGALAPVLADGADAPGAGASVLRPMVGAHHASLGLHGWVRPALRWSAEGGVDAGLGEGWAGWHPRGADGAWTVGVGRRARAFGPARFGGLARSTNAAPNPMGEVAWRGGGARAVRAEVGVGWLDRPRRDVANPGLLQVDVRARPWEWLEAGATRMALFGGDGRPAVDLGELLLPTEPHVYGDPERTLPDQNELAALDVRLALPAAWRPRWLRWAEAWWQYGGEDMVREEVLGVPLPGLAGVANLGGAEVAAGPVVVTVEGSRLMDDTFRWYVGHRVYHDGFRQDGKALGVPAGPDSATWTGAVGALARGGDARVRVRASHVAREGVVESRDGVVYALVTPERALRVGLDADLLLGDWRLAAEVEAGRTTGAAFVPGAIRSEARATLAATWMSGVGVR